MIFPDGKADRVAYAVSVLVRSLIHSGAWCISLCARVDSVYTAQSNCWRELPMSSRLTDESLTLLYSGLYGIRSVLRSAGQRGLSYNRVNVEMTRASTSSVVTSRISRRQTWWSCRSLQKQLLSIWWHAASATTQDSSQTPKSWMTLEICTVSSLMVRLRSSQCGSLRFCFEPTNCTFVSAFRLRHRFLSKYNPGSLVLELWGKWPWPLPHTTRRLLLYVAHVAAMPADVTLKPPPALL